MNVRSLHSPVSESIDIAVIGAGAAGLMAAIFAGRTAPGVKVVAFDSAKKLGSKILVAGGGRCNVTHTAVSESSYCGSSRNAIKKVLRRFDVPQTIAFFQELGVELKAEDTGKLFPTTDDAHTILDALLAACTKAGVTIEHPFRVQSVRFVGDEFQIEFDPATPRASVQAKKLILATGGKSLPKTGSDGHGYTIARAFGHSLTPRIVPALVPLTVQSDHPLLALSGLAIPMTLQVTASSGKKLTSFTNSTLCTHFGLSGPGPLDISRHLQHAQLEDSGASLNLNVLPGRTTEELDAFLTAAGNVSVLNAIRRFYKSPPTRTIDDIAEGVDLLADLPERIIRALVTLAGADASAPCHSLTRETRKRVATSFTNLKIPVTGTRGFTYSEVTAGGIPLAEFHLDSLESRVHKNLHICGELLDVDGQIGGYNFQWAWASGFVAGTAAARC